MTNIDIENKIDIYLKNETMSAMIAERIGERCWDIVEREENWKEKSLSPKLIRP